MLPAMPAVWFALTSTFGPCSPCSVHAERRVPGEDMQSAQICSVVPLSEGRREPERRRPPTCHVYPRACNRVADCEHRGRWVMRRRYGWMGIRNHFERHKTCSVMQWACGIGGAQGGKGIGLNAASLALSSRTLLARLVYILLYTSAWSEQ